MDQNTTLRGRSHCFLQLIVSCCVLHLASISAGRVRAECKVGSPLSAGNHADSLAFDGIMHSVYIHVPPGYEGTKPVPLVIDLHGFSGNGPGQFPLSGFDRIADKYGFIAVAPTGYMGSWNGDIPFGQAYADKIDDVGFMKELVRYVGTLANIDRGKVYVTGLSNGAAMSNTLGCKAPDTFAAVAPVADPLDIGRDTCMPVQPTSVLGFHGYGDDAVPYDGGVGNGPPLPAPFPSIPDTLKAWATIMGCTGMPETMMLQGTSKCEFYRECGAGTEVGYCSLEGPHLLYQQTHLDIADYAWKFFDRFSLPLPDRDSDGVNDADDNCAARANPDQEDANDNCIGDACECNDAGECDDHIFCNGAETCSDHRCEPGVEPCISAPGCDEPQQQCRSATTLPAAGSSAMAGASGGSANMSIAGAGGSSSSAARSVSPAAGSGGSADAQPPTNMRTTTTGARAGSPSVVSAVDSNPAPASADGSGCGCRMAAGSGGKMGLASFVLLGIAWVRVMRRHAKRPLNNG